MNTSTEPEHKSCRHPISTLLALERDYIHGNGTIGALARKWGVGINYAYDLCYRGQWKARRDKWEQRQREAMEPSEPAQPAMAQEPARANGAQGLAGKVAELESQLATIDKLFTEAESAKDIAAITQAKERLLNMHCLLTHHPRQPVLKSRSPRSPYSSSPQDPTPSDPEPTAPEPSSPTQPPSSPTPEPNA